MFIEQHCERFGVEPICETFGVSASACYERASGRRSARQVEDERLLDVICELQSATICPTARRRCGRRCCAPASRSAAAVWNA
jgi:hypothetical protein